MRTEIVAHRGAAGEVPENTVSAFQRAVDMGADAVELDVRLTADRVPVVHHYYLLGSNASASGAIFEWTWDQLRKVELRNPADPSGIREHIPSLDEILAIFGGKIGLEIHLQGPEPESPVIVGMLLSQHKSIWETVEVTSYEAAALLEVQQACPGLPTDLLLPLSEPWKTPQIERYEAVERGRMARARAVHLHPTQLSESTVSAIRESGIEVHAWDVNEQKSLELVRQLEIPRIDTDQLQRALDFWQRAAIR